MPRQRPNASALLLPALALVAAGCVPAKRDYSAFYAHPPRSILVVPVANETSDVSASAVFMTTVSVPLADRGYYVFPVYLTDALLKDLGLTEGGMVQQLPPERFFELFGGDAVLFVVIKDWSTKYLVIQSSTVVEIGYRLLDTRSGTLLWEHTQVVSEGSGQSTDPIGAAIAAVVHYVVSEMTEGNYRALAVRANVMAFGTPGTGLPAGPYSPAHHSDRDQF